MEIEEYIVADDQQLVELVLQGDDSAFEHLFTRYREAISRLFVARMGGGGQDVEDLLQETFIKVYINISRYNNNFTFGQWIYTIARNTFIDFKRKQHDDLAIDERTQQQQSSAPTPEQSIINSQQINHIESAIKQLNPTQQQLFKMRFLEEYSYEEIAQKLDMPMGSVKTNIHRARSKMCELITESENR